MKQYRINKETKADGRTIPQTGPLTLDEAKSFIQKFRHDPDSRISPDGRSVYRASTWYRPAATLWIEEI